MAKRGPDQQQLNRPRTSQLYAVTVFFHFLVADPSLQIIPQDIPRKYIMSTREKIRPKLYDLDQEKLSRLFADLQRESMATGSYPTTTRTRPPTSAVAAGSREEILGVVGIGGK
jgi:DNA replicative helicase MCM subunit Mcm2 (Cdc46/Mcm family)